MAAKHRKKPHPMTAQWLGVRRRVPGEAIGIVLAVLGAVLLLLVLRYDPTRGTAPPFLVILTGWTAPWVAFSLFAAGAVVALHGRAGYWSAEALIGAEVLLLGLMTASYVADNDAALWFPRQDGEAGGLVGWALGSLLLGIAGRPLAWIAAISLCIVGVVLLVRYTPLIYPAAWLVRQARAAWDAWRQRRADAAGEDSDAGPTDGSSRLPQTANFVPAQSAAPVSPEIATDPSRPVATPRKKPAPGRRRRPTTRRPRRPASRPRSPPCARRAGRLHCPPSTSCAKRRAWRAAST